MLRTLRKPLARPLTLWERAAVFSAAVLLALLVRNFALSGSLLFSVKLHEVCIATADPPAVSTSRGTAEALLNVAQSLAARGNKVHVLVVSSQPKVCLASVHKIAFSSAAITSSCVLTDGDSSSFLFAPHARLLAHLSVHKIKCDVLITHEWWALGMDILASRFFGEPQLPEVVVVNVHGGVRWSGSWQPSTELRYIDVVEDTSERIGAFLADRVVFPTDYMREYHESRWQIPPKNALTISNIAYGYDLSRGNKWTPFAGIAYAGSVEQRKGIHFLVTVLSKMEHVGSVDFHVFGSIGFVGNQSADAYIAEVLDAAPHVKYTIHGAVPSDVMWKTMQKLRLLLVMPSLLENQPMIIVNAQKYRIPVICFDVGGLAEMLTPKSRSEVLVQPGILFLQAKLEDVFSTHSAAVPVLSGKVLSAELDWIRFVQRVPVVWRNAEARTRGNYEVMTVSETDTTDSIHKRAMLAPKAVFLLTSTQYSVAPEASGFLAEMAQTLRGRAGTAQGVAGATGLVRYGDTLLYPDAPYLFPARGWTTCAPEAPVLILAAPLIAFTTEHPGIAFRPWLLTLWLIYKGGANDRMIVRVPRVMFLLSGGVDPLLCFEANLVQVALPEAVVADVRGASSLVVPSADVAEVRASVRFDYGNAIRRACRKNTHAMGDTVWMAAVAEPEPKLCSDSVEHGLFTLMTLKTSLLRMCGTYCVFPLDELLRPPTPSFAWGLDTDRMCFREVSSLHSCSLWYSAHVAASSRTFPVALPPLVSASTNASASCARVDANESSEAQEDARERCAVELLVAHFSGCYGDDMDAVDAWDVGKQPTRAQLQHIATDGLRLGASATTRFPSTIRGLFPTARLAVLVCDPVPRAQREFESWVASGDVAPLRFFNITTFDDAVRLLSPTDGQCLFSKSMPAEQLQHCEALNKRLLFLGMYALHLQDWMTEFGRLDVLVLDAAASPARNTQLLAEFAGGSASAALPTAAPPQIKHARLMVRSKKILNKVFAPHNEWLAKLISEPFPSEWHT